MNLISILFDILRNSFGRSLQWIKDFIIARYPNWYFSNRYRRLSRINPYFDENRYGTYRGKGSYTLGILKEFAQYHRYYIAACRDMDISYKVLDITDSDWIEVVKHSKCDAFLVWPSPVMSIWKEMYDERLKIMVDDLKRIIFPSYEELWMWESKRRMHDWLSAHDVPQPETKVFYDIKAAARFIENASFPLVYKPNHGDSAKGIKILRTKNQALQILKKAFTKGIRLPNAHPCEIQWGSVVLQEYIQDHIEWRMVRVGESYFGYVKERIGDFASGVQYRYRGAKAFSYPKPPEKLLNFVRHITEEGGFKSMSFDILVTPDEQYFVTELQSIFGYHITRSNERPQIAQYEPGRYLYNSDDNSWRFEKGYFDQNMCCCLRVEVLIDILNNLNNT